jgi:hypothetical protein
MEVAATLGKMGCEKYRKRTLQGQLSGYLGVRCRLEQACADRAYRADLVY